MVNYSKYFIALIIIVFSFSSGVKASHISGGDISYECIGQDSFLVTLKLFRDCSGINIQTSVPMTFTSTCGGSVAATLFQNSFSEISQLCPTQLSNSTCNGGSLPGLEEYVFSGIVVLAPACNTWAMSWSSCCRNNIVTNLTNPSSLGTYLYATLYSGVDSCNSSPVFTSAPAPFVCLNQTVNYNFGVIEPDGDSLVYFLSPGYTAVNTLVGYSGTYSYLQPIAGSNVVLNSSNGQLIFTPTAIGVYVVVVRVEEYDRSTGMIKGKSIRDIQVVVQSCTNNSPLIDSPGIYNYLGDGSRIDSNTIEVCVGDSFSFDIAISDSNISDTVTILHNIYQALDSTVSVSVTDGNPAILHVGWIVPAGFNLNNPITISGMDNACPVLGAISGYFNITINSSTYAGEDKSICAGSQWVDLNATGGTSFLWAVISGSPIDTVSTSSNFNMSCFHCETPSVSPQVTTTYVVYSNLSGTCSNVDTVVVSVLPDFTILVPNDTIICSIDSFNLFVNTNPVSSNYSYQWSNGNTLTNDTISNPVAFPSVNTTYSVSVESSGGCVKTDQVTIGLSAPFPAGINVTGDSLLCQGESSQLVVNLGYVSSPTCGISTNTCNGSISSSSIGTGILTNTITSYPAPYSNYYWGAKHQILYTAAELHAMGMVMGGLISSIAFEIVSVGNVNYNNFEIKIGCTSSSDLSGGWETGLVTVVPAYTHVPVVGWNQHTFLNPYNWDGVSNLVIEICQNNSSWSSAGSSLSRYTPTSFQSVRYYRADNANVCSSTNVGAASSNRPNTLFNYCSSVNPNNFTYSWGPNTNIDSVNIATPTVNPNTTTTYTVIVQDINGACSDTISHQVSVVTEFDAGFNFNSPYCISAPVDTLIPVVSGGLFTGSGVSATGGFDPSSAGLGTWPINYNISTPALCANDSTMLITVIPLPDATITYQEICQNGGLDTLSAATTGGTWSGTGIMDSINGVFDPTGLASGSYQVVYTLESPCHNSDTILINIIEPYAFTFNNPLVDVCEGSTIDLYTAYTVSSNPLQGNGPILATWSDVNGYIDNNGLFDATNVVPGSYTITLAVAGPNGECGTSQNMTVQVNQIDYPSSTVGFSFCETQTSAILVVSPWLFGNGMSYSQTPLSPLGANDTLDILPFGSNGKFDPTVVGAGYWKFEMTYTNLNGCTGVFVDTIRVLPTADTAVTNLGSELIVEAVGGYSYQWVDCDNGMTPIFGATNQSFIPGAKGHYAVEITVGNCVITSGCHETWPLSIDDVENDLGVSIYPNPMNNLLNIDKGENKEVNVVITDNSGKVILSVIAKNQVTAIDMSKLASGIYFVKMDTEKGVFTEKIVKR